MKLNITFFILFLNIYSENKEDFNASPTTEYHEYSVCYFNNENIRDVNSKNHLADTEKTLKLMGNQLKLMGNQLKLMGNQLKESPRKLFIEKKTEPGSTAEYYEEKYIEENNGGIITRRKIKNRLNRETGEWEIDEEEYIEE